MKFLRGAARKEERRLEDCAFPHCSTDARQHHRLRPNEDVTNNPRSEAVMSEQAQAIFDEAMKLPIGERESLVSRLMRANDEEPLTDAELAAHDEAWAPEIRRRMAELESGQMQTVPWSEVRAELRAMIGD